ncbi:hypothetical protein V6N11_056061 [Hibiscus sabdariffa]|uniref:Uncharacterized protein n=1 Tax=Hibiscus sabdariffa TaxID=183260 RepID=A0ABR2T313_9ROSI
MSTRGYTSIPSRKLFRYKSEVEVWKAIKRGSGRLIDGFIISIYNTCSNKENKDNEKSQKVQARRPVLRVKDFRSYKEELLSSEKLNQQREANSKACYCDLTNGENPTVSGPGSSGVVFPDGYLSVKWASASRCACLFSWGYLYKGSGRGSGPNFNNSFAIGRRLSFDYVSNESRLQEVQVEGVGELAQQAFISQAHMHESSQAP